jgi:hypothetical protein
VERVRPRLPATAWPAAARARTHRGRSWRARAEPGAAPPTPVRRPRAPSASGPNHGPRPTRGGRPRGAPAAHARLVPRASAGAGVARAAPAAAAPRPPPGARRRRRPRPLGRAPAAAALAARVRRARDALPGRAHLLRRSQLQARAARCAPAPDPRAPPPLGPPPRRPPTPAWTRGCPARG